MDPQDLGHSDVQQDLALIQPLVQAVQFLAEQLEVANERLGKLEGVVMDDLIGGIVGQYQDNQRTTGIEALKGKYGSAFEPHMPAIKALYGDMDIFGKLHDLKSEGGLDDEGVDAQVQLALQELTSKLDAIRGTSSQSEPSEEAFSEEEAPQEAEITTVKASPNASEDLLATVKAMKSRKNPTSLA